MFMPATVAPAVRGRRRRIALLTACCVVLAGPVAGCSAGGPGQHGHPPSQASAGQRTRSPAPRPSAADRVAPLRVPAMAGGPARLAARLTAAERRLGAGAGDPARQALVVQLACLRAAVHPGWAAAVLARVGPAQRAAAGADLAATADLVALTPPRTSLPPWRIVAAQSLPALRADYQAAQSATGVPWFYLAAINFVETDFGRIMGRSSAGAQGPMQFLLATWAIYGHGSISRPRNAILAAARLLADHGAARSIAAAVYAYNPSPRYVDAVLRYAHRLRHDPQALTGYYHRSVICRLASGWVLLPARYGTDHAVRPITLHL